MDFEKVVTWIGYGVALAGVFWKLKSDIRNIETENKSQKELVAMQFLNKAEKVDMLIKFKDTISETMSKEFAELKESVAKVDKTLSNITTTLSLCDVTPKRRENDK